MVLQVWYVASIAWHWLSLWACLDFDVICLAIITLILCIILAQLHSSNIGLGLHYSRLACYALLGLFEITKCCHGVFFYVR